MSISKFGGENNRYMLTANEAKLPITRAVVDTLNRYATAINKALSIIASSVLPLLNFHITIIIFNATITAVIAIITEDKRMVGIVVDKVDDVQKIDSNHLSPVSDMGSAIPSKYLKGFLRMDNNEMLVVMDIESVIHKEELKKS